MSVDEQWNLVLELTNEATVLAELIGDYSLANLASDAALGAAERLGISSDRVNILRQALRKRAEGAPPGIRLSPPIATQRLDGGRAVPKTGARRSERPKARPRGHARN